MLKRLLSIQITITLYIILLLIPLDNRALIQIHGADTPKFLQGLITNDIEFLQDYECYL